MHCQTTSTDQEVIVARMKRQTFSSKTLTLVFFGMILGLGMTSWFVDMFSFLRSNIDFTEIFISLLPMDFLVQISTNYLLLTFYTN